MSSVLFFLLILTRSHYAAMAGLDHALYVAQAELTWDPPSSAPQPPKINAYVTRFGLLLFLLLLFIFVALKIEFRAFLILGRHSLSKQH